MIAVCGPNCLAFRRVWNFVKFGGCGNAAVFGHLADGARATGRCPAELRNTVGGHFGAPWTDLPGPSRLVVGRPGVLLTISDQYCCVNVEIRWLVIG